MKHDRSISRNERAARLRTMYDRAIAGHQILQRHIDDDGQHARFVLGTQGSSFYLAEIVVLSWGHLLVHGDIDTVVFGRCSYKKWREVITWMSGEHYDYAEEKASIGSGCSELAREYDPDVAARDILNWRRMKYIDHETARKALYMVRNGEEHDARQLIFDAAHDGELYDLGMCTASRVIMAQAVLTRLVALLEAEDKTVAESAAE